MSVRITDLPEATELNGSELMPIVQNGVTRRTTLDFVNQAAPAALILQQTQQVLADTQQVKAETDQVLVNTEGVYNQTVMVRGQVDISIADWETQYLGAKSDPPTTDNEGNPLQKGALYWDTSLNAMFVWDGTSWTAFSSAVASVNGQIGEVVLDYADVGAAASTRTVTAGNGLTGGGNLTADRTLTLGTPSTLTTATTNAVTATSHTHAVTFPVTSVAGKTGAVTLAKADVGLGNADNTSDANKPISTATQAALDLKLNANDASVTNAREWTASTVTQAEAEAGTATTRQAWTAQRVFQAIAAWWNASTFKTKLDGIEAGAQVNTVSSVAGKTGAVTLSKSDVGLGNVDNTSDANKPVSTAVQTALDGKENTIAAGTTSQYWRGDKSWSDFFTNVRSATLTGLSTATNAVITATDTVLSATGKLQAQVTGLTISKLDVAATSFGGNAATATKLQTARSISLAGDVTGSATFDGSANISITATVADDSHNHVISNVNGLQSALDLKVSKDNVVGTVSQSGGIPTGAIIERGSNANGEYVRFADGTQICTRFITAINDGTGPGGSKILPVAAVFYNNNFIISSCTDNATTSNYMLVCSPQSTSEIRTFLRGDDNGTGRIVPLSPPTAAGFLITAIGRWY